MTKRIEKQKVAFTLGEVLITLAIIGVVAAVTLPMLVKNYQKKTTVIKLRKTISTLNQALKLSEVDNGDYEIWQQPSSTFTFNQYVDTYWLPYMKIAKRCTSMYVCGYKPNYGVNFRHFQYNGGTIGISFFVANNNPIMLQDGTVIKFDVLAEGGYADANQKIIRVDLNGSKKPNKLGRDLFYLIRNEKGYIGPYYSEKIENTRDSLSLNCRNSGRTCARLIELDGWKINYPW